MILTEYDQERHIKNEKHNSYLEGCKEGVIMTTIQIYKRIGWGEEDICKVLIEECELSENEAKEYIKKYCE